MTSPLDGLVVRVTSPDNQIRAAIRHPHEVSVEFRPGAYARYDVPGLERQLTGLAALCWTGFRRGLTQAATADGVSFLVGEEHDPSPAGRAYRAGLAEIEVRAESPGGWVRLATKGFLRWKVAIRPGALERLPEGEFLAETTAALRRVFAEHDRKVMVLKDEHFRLDLPPGMRDWLNDAYPLPKAAS
ncbi:hypothetical protein [Phytomonospora endophytica]|uniref:Uncharacterized protein n=1 Tax=Phytomonospora endophytica TaxID=714109 RepID=A0A841FZU1_9ACTN|nr:hypothetical protein [Phytomonospora endophytica]MBB6039042.1 hypothetical protein [Phytomonospora endophytica]GIG69520.1 hypothetical protein Pen01_58150 [Phytomonospora endophytica]